MVGNYAYPDSRKRLLDYYKSVCLSCSLSCCTHNISPVVHYLSVEDILNSAELVLVEKALELDSGYKQIFQDNVRASLRYIGDKGFSCDLDYLEKNDYSLKSVVTIYRDLDKEIELYNEKMENRDYGKAFNSCFFLIPGTGCILQDYRPAICKLTLRKCFKDLSLYDFVEGNIRKTDSSALLGYIKRDFEDSFRGYMPKIIIGATEDFKASSRKFMTPYMMDLGFEKISYIQAAQTADFLPFPFRYKPENSKFVKDNIMDKYPESIQERFISLIFVDKLVRGKEDKNFGFGLEWLEAFKLQEE